MTTIAAVKKWTAAHPRWVALTGLSLAHFVVCWGAFLMSYQNTLARFESGRLPNQFEASVQSLFDTLSFPFLMLAGHGPAPLFQTWYGAVPVLLTSMLWGAAMYFGFLGLRRAAQLKQRPQRRVQVS